jgi:hypothetical protein
MAFDDWEERPMADKIRISITHTRPSQFDIKELGAIMHILGRTAA